MEVYAFKKRHKKAIGMMHILPSGLEDGREIFEKAYSQVTEDEELKNFLFKMIENLDFHIDYLKKAKGYLEFEEGENNLFVFI